MMLMLFVQLTLLLHRCKCLILLPYKEKQPGPSLCQSAPSQVSYYFVAVNNAKTYEKNSTKSIKYLRQETVKGQKDFESNGHLQKKIIKNPEVCLNH